MANLKSTPAHSSPGLRIRVEISRIQRIRIQTPQTQPIDFHLKMFSSMIEVKIDRLSRNYFNILLSYIPRSVNILRTVLVCSVYKNLIRNQAVSKFGSGSDQIPG